VNPEDPTPTSPREIRVEGMGLLVLAGGGLALLAVVFMIGVWVGRSSSSEPGSPPGPSVGDRDVERSPDLKPTGSYFDTLEGGEKSPEPRREMSPATTKASARTAPEIASPGTPTHGTYFVQVFAGRDRHAADAVVQSIAERGYRVRIDTSSEGTDVLYKVRVGGYLTQDDARAAAESLKKEGEGGAWVTQIR